MKLKDLLKNDNEVTITPILKAMDLVIMNKVKSNKVNKRILDSPWIRVPNIKTFSISASILDPIAQLCGVDLNLPRKLEFTPYKNHRINRYLENQIRRLQVTRSSNPRLYFDLGKILMKRSNSFRVEAIQHTFPNWYRNYPLGFILNVNRKVSKLINEGKDDLDFKRVYIPKGDDKRPLGVPTPEWRLYLHMWNNLLTYYLSPHLTQQHGFITGKGTLTAWKEIMEKQLYKKPFIREWDFKSFFDSWDRKSVV